MAHRGNSSWGAHVESLLINGINRGKKGDDAGDHPPITPMRSASEGQLHGDSWRVYDYITRHFLATISNDCTYEQTKVRFVIGDTEFFACKGKPPTIIFSPLVYKCITTTFENDDLLHPIFSLSLYGFDDNPK